MIYAVIDTNVLVSALYTSNHEAATVRVLRHVFNGNVMPLYNQEIIAEYYDILLRPKFHFAKEKVETVIKFIKDNGIDSERVPYDDTMPDEDDRVFYEISLSNDNSFLVTGNLKHFPHTPKVLPPTEFLKETGLN